MDSNKLITSKITGEGNPEVLAALRILTEHAFDTDSAALSMEFEAFTAEGFKKKVTLTMNVADVE